MMVAACTMATMKGCGARAGHQPAGAGVLQPGAEPGDDGEAIGYGRSDYEAESARRATDASRDNSCAVENCRLEDMIGS